MIAAAARAGDAARARLGGAINDLFRPIETRLSDREHAFMSRMLPELVAEIEMELRRLLVGQCELPADIVAALADPGQPIAAPRLARTRIMRDSDLAAAMLRRCDEHHLSRRLQQAHSTSGGALERLSLEPDHAIRAQIAALLVAQAQRVDPFGDPLLSADDLTLGVLHRLGWWVAAILREHLQGLAVAPDEIERGLSQAVVGLVSERAARATLDMRALEFAEALEARGQLDDHLLTGLLQDGQLLFWNAALSARSGIAPQIVATMLGDSDCSRLILVLRAIGVQRATMLGMLEMLLLARATSRPEIDQRLDDAASAVDNLAPEAAARALLPWRHGSSVEAGP